MVLLDKQISRGQKSDFGTLLQRFSSKELQKDEVVQNDDSLRFPSKARKAAHPELDQIRHFREKY